MRGHFRCFRTPPSAFFGGILQKSLEGRFTQQPPKKNGMAKKYCPCFFRSASTRDVPATFSDRKTFASLNVSSLREKRTAFAKPQFTHLGSKEIRNDFTQILATQIEGPHKKPKKLKHLEAWFPRTFEGIVDIFPFCSEVHAPTNRCSAPWLVVQIFTILSYTSIFYT